MRSLLGQFIVPVLATLLVLTTPVGTGQGVHQDELLHPVLPHMHMIGGRVLTDAQVATTRADAVPSRGPAFGAGVGAYAASLGLALGPTLPELGLALLTDEEHRLVPTDGRLPTEFRTSPQDPPPVLFA